MKISLVIPVHNLEKFIEPMLCSLKYQLYDHNEVEPIFICDSCEDRTHEIIENYLRESYPNMVIIDREYHSSGLSRNDGLELATGELIWLLDGDDWLVDNGAIEKVVHFFGDFPEENVLHLSWIHNYFHIPNYCFTVWQWVFKADWAKSVKFSSQKYDDDVKWVKDLMEKYGGFKNCKTILAPLYFYNFNREGSVMSERLKELKNGKN